jgi:hypothetical protein
MSDNIEGCPRFISSKFGYTRSYVWERLFPDDYRKRALQGIRDKEMRKEKMKNMRRLSDEAALLVFIFDVHNYLEEGTRDAELSVDTLKSLGVNGYKIGSSLFSERNENVMMGQTLADEMIRQLGGEEFASTLKQYKDHHDIISEYEKRRTEI